MSLYKKAKSALKIAKNRGVSSLGREILVRLQRKALARTHQRQLEDLLSSQKPSKVFILHPTFTWNSPMQQRPHHMATQLARQGALYFFCSANPLHDGVSGFKRIEEGLYLTDRYDLLKKIESRNSEVVRHFYATDFFLTWEPIAESIERGHQVVYEFVDEISEELAQMPICDEVKERHENALAHPEVLVLATADRLLSEVKRVKAESVLLSPNAADYDHFSRFRKGSDSVSKVEGDVFHKGKLTIGYFGALAKWIDYGLIERIAAEFSDAQIVLIGQDYDGSLKGSRLHSYPNVKVLDAVPYAELPNYAQNFDVAILPFLVNEITLATSPIKIFEYMALGTPIVSTDLPECRKYKSVLVSDTAEGFVSNVYQACALQNDEYYMATLDSEALENTWQTRAKRLIGALVDRKGASKENNS